jgi:hypothetical protein
MMNFKTDCRTKLIPSLSLIGLVGVLLAGCSPSSPEVTPSLKPQETIVPSPSVLPTPTAIAAPFTFPLTGLPSNQEIKSRPFMVMVENSPQARPQTGLDQADIVYEILAEGEITRFVSVFQSHDVPVIGPVRSIRPYFVEIGAALDAVIVHAGWSQDAMNILVGRKLSHLDQVYGDEAFYWRDNDRKAPHNLYTSTEKMTQGAEARNFRKEWKAPTLTFAKEGQSSILAGSPAEHIKIPYIMGYVVSYDYDKDKGTYKRSMDGKPHLDKVSGNQLTAMNLLVLQSKHQILDKAGRRDVDIFGPGQGIFLQQGKKQDITWEQKDGIIRAFAVGKEVPLLPGTTWVQIVPEGTNVTTE